MIQILSYYHLDHLCGTVTDFFIFFHNYYCTLLNYSSASQHLHLLHYLFGYCLFRLCSYWTVHNLMLLAYFFRLLFLLLYLLLLQQLLYFPAQVCTHHFSHKHLISASWSWAQFHYLCCMFHEHYHLPPSIFSLNFDGWSLVLFSKYIIFWYSIFFLYIYNCISLSIICCDFSGGMYISLGISVGCGICLEVDFLGSLQVLFEAAGLILSEILFPNRSPGVSTSFWITLLEALLRTSVVNFFFYSNCLHTYCQYFQDIFCKG